MPVILGDKGSTDIWLNGSSSSKFDMMLKPYEDSDLVCSYECCNGMISSIYILHIEREVDEEEGSYKFMFPEL